MIILSFFKGKFQFTGYFYCFYWLFSVFLQVIFRITGFFSISTACLQYYRDLSLFLQVSSSILHVVFNFLEVIFLAKKYFHHFYRLFSRLQVFFCKFIGYFQFYYRLFSVFLQVIFKIFTDFFQYFHTVILNVFTVFFQKYRFFSLLLQVFFKIFTGFFQCYSLFSIILQAIFNFQGDLVIFTGFQH